jgi:hypothetical protein
MIGSNVGEGKWFSSKLHLKWVANKDALLIRAMAKAEITSVSEDICFLRICGTK